jgi:hypothetical protein
MDNHLPKAFIKIMLRNMLYALHPPYMGESLDISQFMKKNLGLMSWRDVLVPRQAVLVATMYRDMDGKREVWSIVGWMSVWFGIIPRHLRNFRMPYRVPRWVLKYFDLETIRNLSDKRYDTFEELIMDARMHGISCRVISPFTEPII